jgi:hypothetical protein
VRTHISCLDEDKWSEFYLHEAGVKAEDYRFVHLGETVLRIVTVDRSHSPRQLGGHLSTADFSCHRRY